jgi:hypothetical protein
MKIVREKTKATGGITAAEKLALDAHAKKWIANAMSTEPVDRGRLVSAMKSLYAAAGLKEPRVVIVSSPIVMAFAGGFAAAIWWTRKNIGTDIGGKLAFQATRQATRQATYQATDRATRQATYQATRQATDQATRQATDRATFQATDQATINSFVRVAYEISSEFGVDHKFMLSCAQNWWDMYQGGNMWSSYDCYLSACRDVLKLTLPSHEKYRAWESCAIEGGFRLMHDEFCIVSDRPEILSVDEQNRPHNETGPSHRWRDGWHLYHWHGLRLDETHQYIIHSPQLITVEAIEAEKNAEIRRVMMEKFGYAKYISECNAVVVDEVSSDHDLIGLRSARLLKKEVPGDEPIVYVDLLNSTPEPDGTTKRYLLRVDPNAYRGDAAKYAHAAAASTWRNQDGSLAVKDWRDYAPEFES